MKRRNHMKRMSKAVMAITLTFALTLTSVCGGVCIHGVTPEAKKSLAADTTGKYVKDIKISHKSSKDEAEKELGPDYTVLDRNFNKGMSGDSWIGYSTTNDPDLAITDIKAMGMDGNFSESDYKTFLDNHIKDVDEQLKVVIPAIIEYAKNYDSGMKTAEDICSLLNLYYEEDSGKNMGDLLLEMGRSLQKDKNDSNATGILKKIFVQGNNAAVIAIENLLVKAGDTKLVKNGSWLTRMSLLGPNGLYEIYKQVNKGKKKNAILNLMDADLGDEAKDLLAEMGHLREILDEAENSSFAEAADDEASVDKMVSDVVEAKPKDIPFDSDSDKLVEAMYAEAENATNGISLNNEASHFVIAEILKDTPYGDDKSMYDFFMNEKIEKKDLYTLAYVLSDGQKGIIRDIGIYPIFESILTEYTEENNSKLDEILDNSDLGEGLLSVYEGIDRSIFEGDTAITDDTLKNMETKQVFDVIQPDNKEASMLFAVAASIVGVVFTGAAITVFQNRVYTTQTTAYRVVEKITPVVKNMQKNLVLMQTYDNVWKLHYLELHYKISPFQEELGKIALDSTAKTKISELYTKTLEAMRKAGLTELAAEVESFGAKTQKSFTHFYKNAINLELYRNEAYTVTNRFKIPRGSVSSRILFTLGAVAAFAFAGYEIYCLTKKTTYEFGHIPANMLSRTYGDNTSYVTYHAVTDSTGKATDLHDSKGKGWQVIYTTSDCKAGEPVIASSLEILDASTTSDLEKKGLMYFGSSDPANLGDSKYTGKKTDQTYIFYKTDDASDEEVYAGDNTESSVFGGPGMIWIVLIMLVVAGFAAVGGVIYRKRRSI